MKLFKFIPLFPLTFLTVPALASALELKGSIEEDKQSAFVLISNSSESDVQCETIGAQLMLSSTDTMDSIGSLTASYKSKFTVKAGDTNVRFDLTADLTRIHAVYPDAEISGFKAAPLATACVSIDRVIPAPVIPAPVTPAPVPSPPIVIVDSGSVQAEDFYLWVENFKTNYFVLHFLDPKKHTDKIKQIRFEFDYEHGPSDANLAVIIWDRSGDDGALAINTDLSTLEGSGKSFTGFATHPKATIKLKTGQVVKISENRRPSAFPVVRDPCESTNPQRPAYCNRAPEPILEFCDADCSTETDQPSGNYVFDRKDFYIWSKDTVENLGPVARTPQAMQEFGVQISPSVAKEVAKVEFLTNGLPMAGKRISPTVFVKSEYIWNGKSLGSAIITLHDGSEHKISEGETGL
ncbi:MAG: hypothetical protein EOP04_01695 [Proteobacteria bacterium]|nr:MAG: hypothetical protein EOP04_01695 [Pseudomonadota bacterium]